MGAEPVEHAGNRTLGSIGGVRIQTGSGNNPKKTNGLEGLKKPLMKRGKMKKSTQDEWNNIYGMQVFDQWWDKYPRKTSKPVAKKAFRKALDKASPATLLAAVIVYRDDPNRVQAFTKHPSTWLNQECWEDEALPPRPDSSSGRKMQRTADILDWAREQDEKQRELGQ
jgi:hypothetical protein